MPPLFSVSHTNQGSPAGTATTLRDPPHPRSRGVYSCRFLSGEVAGGSSPLARGLPLCSYRALCRGGIIPARAGFTSSAWMSSPLTGDHPRSRGVYVADAGGNTVPAGSSPLARGLPRTAEGCDPVPGIIPARAGFTAPTERSPSYRQDHPRSRGVYYDYRPDKLVKFGSSPLARGLRHRRLQMIESARIIPARAGFTVLNRGDEIEEWDHPRSRGVYSGPPVAGTRGSGSSPLARGLLPATHERSLNVGIIPARAGFTVSREGFSAWIEDHPRSRGVYTIKYIHEYNREGSSPLARGLRLNVQERFHP